MIASDLFARIHEILTDKDMQPAVVNKMMHETLVLVCHEGTRGTNQSYGNLFSQVDFLCKTLHIKSDETAEIQRMRRHSNHAQPLTPEERLYDVRALALLIAAVFSEGIPSDLLKLLPTTPSSFTRRLLPKKTAYLRCIVKSWNERDIQVTTDDDNVQEVLNVRYGEVHQGVDLRYLKTVLREGMQLNVLDAVIEEEVLVPRLIIVEPDFLVDISTIAGCFAEYGHHPLSYLMNQMKPKANTQATLLGNFASAALDDIINQKDVSLKTVLQTNFKEKALEYAVCKDFQSESFKMAATAQIANLKETVNELLKDYERESLIVEPSFVCERLGLQGRVDLMSTDFRLLVEQKSGRNMNIERGTLNKAGSKQLENHYVQLLLYYGILRYNFQVKRSKTDIRLLYSKYPAAQGLMVVSYYQQLFDEALRFRNQMVATQFWIAKNGFDSILPHFIERTINENKLDSSFYHHYLFPQITQITEPLQRLSPLEKAYFSRMMTFVLKEQVLSKVGTQEGVGSADAYLWNMPLAEKKETGNIYTGLTIVKKERKDERSGYDQLTLCVPDQGDDFLPNFRRGDMVYLYAYRSGEVPDACKSILHRGTLTEIHSNRLVVRLMDAQQNPTILMPSRPLAKGGNQSSTTQRLCYAIEHCGTSSATSQVASLHRLMTASQQKRDLLLAQRVPERDETIKLSRNYHTSYDAVVLAAKQAKDYYLLVGPPGTGKTSMALRFLVEEHLAGFSDSVFKELQDDQYIGLQRRGDILLMAYTNRAVDEICGMLVEAGIDFLRIANEYSIDERFKPFLVDAVVGDNTKRDEIRQLIQHKRVVVGTTSMMMSRSFLFQLKHFSLAIVDEASQILEPNLVGLLCEVEKFILIGDYKQLPAVVLQSEEETAVGNDMLRSVMLEDCRNSLFERLIKVEKKAGRTQFVGVLNRQGRMHPDIAHFPTTRFYEEEGLEAVPLMHQQETTLPYQQPSEDTFDDFLKSSRVLFIPSRKEKQTTSDKVNADEARIVADVLRRIYRFCHETFNPDKTVGVIVPYRNQIAMIRKEIEKLGIAVLEKISIDTIERYQGSQRDVIIYSFTICNGYQLEFLTNNCFVENGRTIDRKLNVALTRARRQLIMTGHEETLRQDTVFGDLLNDKQVGKYSG